MPIGPLNNNKWNTLSMFDENTWTKAGFSYTSDGSVKGSEIDSSSPMMDGTQIIKIEPNFYYYKRERNDLQAILGVMLKPISFSINSEWTPMGVPKVPVLGGVVDFMNQNNVGAMMGSGEFGAVYSSKKLWKKSGDLTISPEFRIVDWNGNGEPIRAAQQIAKYALPGKVDSKLNEGLEKIKQHVKEWSQKGVNKADRTLEDSKTQPGNEGQASQALNETTSDAVNRLYSISENVLDDIDDIFKLKNAPPPLIVQIGQYFYHPDMVLTSVGFDFSKEVSKYGPLHVDVKLELVSRKILSGIGDIGVRPARQSKRVQVDGAESVAREITDMGKRVILTQDNINGKYRTT